MSYHIGDESRKVTKQFMEHACRVDPQDLAIAIREAEDLVPLAKALQLLMHPCYLPTKTTECVITAIEDIIKAHADRWPEEEL